MKLFLKKYGIPETEGHNVIDLDTSPCLSIMAKGLGGVSHSQYWIEDDMRIYHENGGFKTTDCTDIPSPTVTATQCRMYVSNEDDGKPGGGNADLTDKPLYAVPTMAEIRALPWNGYKVASTFSGCGGSCTGYRMAGFKVVWANEFVPAAQDSYRANMEPDCILDERDIKKVTAEEILTATGLQRGELDLLDGSPPCQAFSTAGKREKGWGKLKSYEHGARQKNEELFFDYIRLLEGLQPKIFVAENVSGLVKGVAKGFFLEILAGLKACGYKVTAKLLDAQWLGVPQMRQRIIFVGVRNDLGLEPVHPKPLPYRYSVRDALPLIDRISANTNFRQRGEISSGGPSMTVSASGPSKNQSGYCESRLCPDTGASLELDKSRQKVVNGTATWGSDRLAVDTEPCPTIITSTNCAVLKTERRKFTIAELKRICAFPDDFILSGTYSQQWERLGNSVPPVMMYHIAREIKKQILDKI